MPRLHAEVLLQPLAPGNGRQPSSRTLTLASRFLFTARPLGIPPNVTGIMALAVKRCSWVFIKNFLFFDGRKFFSTYLVHQVFSSRCEHLSGNLGRLQKRKFQHKAPESPGRNLSWVRGGSRRTCRDE